MAVLIKDDG